MPDSSSVVAGLVLGVVNVADLLNRCEAATLKQGVQTFVNLEK